MNFIAVELNLDFLVHVDLFICNKRGHQDIAFFQSHPVGSVLPAYPVFFGLGSEPILFFLERELLDFRGVLAEDRWVYLFFRHFRPLEFGHRIVDC